MKTIRNTALLVLLSAGVTFAQQITVQGEKKLNTDFKKYKTFGWVDTGKPGTQLIEYTYEEIVPGSPVSSTDKTYKDKDKNKHDRNKGNMTDKSGRKHHKRDNEVTIYSYSFMIPSQDSTINSAVASTIEDELEGRGYKKDQVAPDLLVAYKIFDSSTKIKGYNDGPTVINGGEEVRQPKDTVSYNLKPGTVLITLIDAKTSGVVWEGFTSGVAKDNDIINDKQKIKEAINLIFKKYEFRGDKYSVN